MNIDKFIKTIESNTNDAMQVVSDALLKYDFYEDVIDAFFAVVRATNKNIIELAKLLNK